MERFVSYRARREEVTDISEFLRNKGYNVPRRGPIRDRRGNTVGYIHTKETPDRTERLSVLIRVDDERLEGLLEEFRASVARKED